MLIVTLLFKFISSIISFKNNLKFIGYFLLGNLAIDITTQILHDKNLMISFFLYLSNATLLFFFSGCAIKNKTIKQTSILSLISIFLFIVFNKNHLSNQMMIIISYYGSLSFIGSISLICNLMKRFSIVTGLMLLFNFGCLMELLVLKLYGISNYWMVNICNLLFYLIVVAVCLLIPKYKHLLKP